MIQSTKFTGILVITLCLGACGGGSSVDNNSRNFDDNVVIGYSSSIPVSEYLFFAGDNGIDGLELWRTDGTQAGTEMVKDINTTPIAENSKINSNIQLNSAMKPLIEQAQQTSSTAAGSNPFGFYTFNGEVYFIATSDGVTNQHWKTDGTESGTTIVTSRNGDALDYSESVSRVKYDGKLYFLANDGSGTQMWGTDGTQEGTTASNFSITSSNIVLFVHGDNIYVGGNHSGLVYVTPSDKGTIIGGAMSSENFTNTRDFLSMEDTLYFVASSAQSAGNSGRELWKYTGGTIMRISDINRHGSSDVSHLTEYNNAVYFSAYDGTGYDLYKTDGISVSQITTFSSATSLKELRVHNGALYYVASNDLGVELRKTVAETENIESAAIDIMPGSASSDPRFITVFNDQLFFSATGPNGNELYRLDNDGFYYYYNIFDDSSSVSGSFPYSLTSFNGKLFFIANNGFNGYEFWSLDRDDTYSMVADTCSGSCTGVQ